MLKTIFVSVIASASAVAVMAYGWRGEMTTLKAKHAAELARTDLSYELRCRDRVSQALAQQEKQTVGLYEVRLQAWKNVDGEKP